jgi:pyridoxine 5-phosphate synthase
VVSRLRGKGMRVSLFVDGDGRPEPMALAKATGAERVELYTGPYGGCYDNPQEAARQVELLGLTADAAQAAGLAVNAGHDLTVANLPMLVKRIPYLAEVSIGHGLTADALEYGMAESVRRFCRACGQKI